jgi:hypothetical protein
MLETYEGIFYDHKGLIFLVVIGLIIFWEPAKALASKAFAWLLSKGSLTSTVAAAVVVADKSVEASVASLQSLTAWAVKEADPETLAKITALFQELQKASQKEAKK